MRLLKTESIIFLMNLNSDIDCLDHNRLLNMDYETHILNFVALNCQGLKEKIGLIETQKLISSQDIFGVSETWLKEGDISSDAVDG